MDIDWRKVVNTLPGPFPEVGLDAPDEEMIKEKTNNSNVKGTLTKITLDIYLFDSPDLDNAYMMQNEKMTLFEDILLKDAIELYNKAKKKTT